MIVSGYYGFNNLGDEAILERLTTELKQLVDADDICVLSADPEKTSRLYGVQSADRWKQLEVLRLLKQARLFVSGGGGLFQDTNSPGSPIFYGFQILMSRLLGARTVVYAQGLGPLRTAVGRFATRESWKQADSVTVRDDLSMKMLNDWGIAGIRSADPVWTLEPTVLPKSVADRLQKLKQAHKRLVGVSLRSSPLLRGEHVASLGTALKEVFSPDSAFLLLPLQADQDLPVLSQLEEQLSATGLDTCLLDTAELELPSQWLSLMGQLDFLVGMRLHALIMALASGVPVLGINYDPKVEQLLQEFQQPILNLMNQHPLQSWVDIAREALEHAPLLASNAQKHSESAKNLACQNFYVLARILDMQSAGNA